MFFPHFIRKLFRPKNSDILSPENLNDRFIGRWENDLDDSSGLHGIWGWAYEFNNDGTGSYYYWSSEDENQNFVFSWERINGNTIKVKHEADQEWTTIEYNISMCDGPYGGKLMKLIDINYIPSDFSKEGFWSSYSALFRQI